MEVALESVLRKGKTHWSIYNCRGIMSAFQYQMVRKKTNNSCHIYPQRGYKYDEISIVKESERKV